MKALIAPSTSPELYLPSGTEFILRLKDSLDVSSLPAVPVSLSAFSPEKNPAVSELLVGRTDFRAQSGKRPSDFVNLLFVGTRQQIDRAFQAAGWSPAEQKSPLSLYRMYNALTRRIGYRRAPMNRLSLNSKRSDFVYQKSLNTIAKRHHVRFWRQTQSADLWLGAATEDIGLRFRLLHWTHIIDPIIDHEQAKVVNDLAFTGCIDSVGLLTREIQREVDFKPSMSTDGRIAAVQFNGCSGPKRMPGIQAKSAPRRRRWLRRVLRSFRDDVVRANPLFTSFNVIRSMVDKEDVRIAAKGSNTGEIRPGLDWVTLLESSPSSLPKLSSAQHPPGPRTSRPLQ